MYRIVRGNEIIKDGIEDMDTARALLRFASANYAGAEIEEGGKRKRKARKPKKDKQANGE